MSTHQRFRQRGGFTATGRLSQYDFHQSCANTSWALVYGPVDTLKTGIYECMDDVVTSDFRKQVATGKTVFNPLKYEKREVVGVGSGYLVTTTANKCASPTWKGESDGRGDAFGQLVPKVLYRGIHMLPRVDFALSQKSVKDLQSEVATQMLNNRGRGDSNLWESVAEIDRTLDMLKSPVASIQKLILSAKKQKLAGHFRGHALTGTSNLWLTYRYGILPLLSDVEGIVKGLSEKVGKLRITTRAKGSDSQTSTSVGSGDFGMLRVGFNVHTIDSVDVRAMSLDEYNATLASNIGFSPKGLVTLPWELLSFSFVYDWVANVGDYLGALVPAFGWDNLGSCLVTTRRSVTSYVSTTGTNLQPATYVVNTFPTGNIVSSLETRVREAVPAPRVVIKNDFRFDKFTRQADSLALIAQQMNKIFR